MEQAPVDPLAAPAVVQVHGRAEGAGLDQLEVDVHVRRETHFADRESMEQMIEMGMEQGMTETLNQVDPLLGAARA